MAAALDRLLDWLMRPRVRRVRRWSFLLTVPVSLLLAHRHGAQTGALVLGARVALWAGVALLAWRLGGARGDAVRDLLMHPRTRAMTRAEIDVWLALPRLAVVALAGRGRRRRQRRR